MPNHIQNRLQFIGTKKDVDDIMFHISSEDLTRRVLFEKYSTKEDEIFDNRAQIDFNKIVPMPKEINIEIGSTVENAVRNSLKIGNNGYEVISQTPLNFSDEYWNQYIQCLNNVKKYGYIYWYDWALANWNTKWNGYSQNETRNNENTIYFQTANSSPVELIKKLSTMFPRVTLRFDYSDEDSGSNTGKLTIKNGEFTKVLQPKNQSKEAYDIYFELHPNRIQDYKLVEGKYEYIEEEV